MAHDDPVAGLTVDADWAYDLSRATTYTPALTATTTDPDLGADGEATGAYHLNGHLVWFWARFHFSGSGLSAGSGDYLIEVPITPDSSILDMDNIAGSATQIGIGYMRDDSATGSNQPCFPYFRTTGVNSVGLRIADSLAGVSDSVPWTWAGGDRIAVSGLYVADSSAL